MMDNAILPILAGLTLGSLHAFDADHITAVSVFVSQHPQPKRAAMFGVRWAMGHTATLFIFGLAAMSLRIVITPSMQTAAEVAIGLMLIVLGVWGIRRLALRERIHIHRHVHDGEEHVHFHSHSSQHDHRHEHSMFLIGAAHGLAGTASVLVVIPLAVVGSILSASLYIVLFGVGTMIAMAGFAYLLGNLATAIKNARAVVWLQGVSGLASIAVGCVWIIERVI